MATDGIFNDRENLVRQGERLDDLGNGVRIIQDPSGYCFTSDSVLLANLVSANKKNTVIDLCSGSGIVGILVNIKRLPKRTVCVEIQNYLADMCERSIRYNDLSNIEVLLSDVRKAHETLGYEIADIITANPPYYRLNEGQISSDERISIARHEKKLNLNELIVSANRLLKYGGRFYVVYRADRLAELISVLSENKLEPKEIICVQPAPEKEIDTVLVVAKKGAEKGVRIRTLLRSDIENDYSILR